MVEKNVYSFYSIITCIHIYKNMNPLISGETTYDIIYDTWLWLFFMLCAWWKKKKKYLNNGNRDWRIYSTFLLPLFYLVFNERAAWTQTRDYDECVSVVTYLCFCFYLGAAFTCELIFLLFPRKWYNVWSFFFFSFDTLFLMKLFDRNIKL